jgi:crotonobetaine/carnitine-CoA ligase
MPESASTIPELFERAVADAPDRIWLRTDDVELTYRQAHERIGGAAAALGERGVGRGTRVLAVAANTPDYLLTWLAAMYRGALYCAVNPKSTEAELAGLVAQFEPELVVDDDNVGALFEQTQAPDGPGPAEPDDAAILIPTSGTTGRSKLVTQTQRAYAMSGEGFPYWMGLDAEDRLMTSLPLFHINGPAYSVLGSVAARAGLVLLPRFSASTFIESARRHGATEFNSIGAMLEILMRRPVREDDADNPLRRCYTGPSPPRERQLEIEARFGLEIVCGYALSESPYGMIWPHGTRPYGTLGRPRQHPVLGHVNDARVLRDGREVEPGEVGELQLRNPTVMLGYWNMPDESEAVLLDGGWLRTGDLVRPEPEGDYTYVGREKDVIRRRGENLAPAEVEEALASHPAVAEAAVVGVPSELSEEEVKAFVVLLDSDGDVEAIRAHAAERLAAFKVPRYIEVVPELPHTPTGRVAKHRLSRERTVDETDFTA